VRWLFLTHRYLGIAIGVLMAVWCITGIVMMYVRYPALSSVERLGHLPPLDWHGCCVLHPSSLADDARIDRFQVEMVGTRPMLSLQTAGGRLSLIDLTDGHTVTMLSARGAEDVATTFSRAANDLGRPQLEGMIDYDQWTVSGEFKTARPLFLFALADADGTQLYVSAVTGKVIQVTTSILEHVTYCGAVGACLTNRYVRGLAACSAT
jgi:hypothetical protein